MSESRDYSLTGLDGQRAKEAGLAGAQWYSCPIPRKRLKELIKRSDQPAIRDTAIWLGAMALFGGLGAWFWGTWLTVPLLRRALRLRHGFALARVRARHRVQDPLDE
jgi:fatty acid desaturase